MAYPEHRPVRLWAGPGEDPAVAWLHSDEADRYQGHWVVLDPDTGAFRGVADEIRDRQDWRARDALVVYVDPPDTVSATPSLEDRVAALEKRFAPLRITYSSLPPLTEAEYAELREAAAEALKLGPPPPLPAPEPPPLSPAQVRYLLRQCVMTVKPGETLVIRGRDWTPGQVREVQDWMDADYESGRIDFKVLAVIGDELGVVQPEEAHGDT